MKRARPNGAPLLWLHAKSWSGFLSAAQNRFAAQSHCTLHRHRGPLRFKNPVLMLLYFGMAAASLLFYWSTSFAFPLMAGTLFSAFINPPSPLRDNSPRSCRKTPAGTTGRPLA